MTTPETPSSLTRTVLRGAGFAGAGFAVAQVINAGAYIVLARLATPQDFGDLAAGMVLLSGAALVAESGMLAALIHRRDRIDEAANTAVVSTVVGGVLLSLLALALSPLVGVLFDSHKVGVVAAAMSGWIALRSAAIVPDAIMQRRFSFLRRVIVDPVGVVAFATVSIVLTANGMGVWGLVIGNYAQAAVMLVASWLLSPWRPNLKLASFAMWRELASYGRHVLASEAVRRFGAQVDVFLVGRFVGTAALGQYTYALRAAVQPQRAVMDVGSYVLFPAFARISADLPRMRRAFVRALRSLALVAIPAGLMMFPLGKPATVLVLGERWNEAGEAVMAMCAYVGARSLVSLSAETFKATGKPNLLPRVNLLSVLLGVITMIALLPLGLLGIATAVSLTAIGVCAYALRLAARIVELGPRAVVREIWPAIVAGVVMAGALFALDRLVVHAQGRETAVGILLLAAEAVAGIVIYVAALALVSPRSARTLLDVGRAARARLARRRSDADQTRPDVADSPQR